MPNNRSLEMHTEVDGRPSIQVLPWPSFQPGISEAIGDQLVSQLEKAEFSLAMCVNCDDASTVSAALGSRITSPFKGHGQLFIGWGNHPELESFWLYVIHSMTTKRPELLTRFIKRETLLILHWDEKHSVLTTAPIKARGANPSNADSTSATTAA